LIDHLRQLASVVERLTDQAAPSPFRSPSLELAIKGVVRDATKRDRRRLPFVDIPRLLHHLRADGLLRDPNLARDQALAAVAAVLPGRRSEWRALSLAHATLVVQPRISSVDAPRSLPLHEWFATPARWRQFDFEIQIVVSGSKADQLERVGYVKRLFHRANDVWSPALSLLNLADHVRRLAPEGASLPDMPLFPIFVNGLHRMSTNAPSTVLQRVSRLKTGVAASAHAFRASSASYLLRIGTPFELVLALGGWASKKALRMHYALHVRPDLPIIAALSGDPVSLSPPSPICTSPPRSPPFFDSPVYNSPPPLSPVSVSPIPRPPRPAYKSISSIFQSVSHPGSSLSSVSVLPSSPVSSSAVADSF